MSRNVRRVFQAASDDEALIYVPAFVLWEMAMLLKSGSIERAGRSFSVEPIQTLDALHLASTLVARSAVPELALLTLDHRMQAAARELGFRLLPESGC